MPLITSSTLVTQIASLIEELILNGTLKAGTRLKEADLEERFGTSRTPLREAFRYLESQGLVETFPRRGSFVKQINTEEISDICEIRVVLEALAVKLAHRRLTPEGLERLRVELDKLRETFESKDATAFINQHEKYHSVLISLAGNQHLEKELYNLRKIMRWHRFYYKYHKENFEYSLQSHELQFKLLSDPNSDDEELARVDSETTRRGCELLLEHIQKTKTAKKKSY